MTKSEYVITRFAPSPTGHLHLGHAYSAKLAHDFAKERGGKFLLRIEDIDHGRCTAAFEDAIYEDLSWIGLAWEKPVRRQSDHMDDYKSALNILRQKDLLYPCFCSRKDIRKEIENSGHAPHGLTGQGAGGPIYPGTCQHMSRLERQEKQRQKIPYALRLDMTKALDILGNQIVPWTDLRAGTQKTSPELLQKVIGDVVLARKDIETSYHLSVVVDDHLQNISHVIRGQDLFHATPLHCLLQFLLGYRTPTYLHHQLLSDKKGQRYAKRDNAKTLRHLRQEGFDPQHLLDNFLQGENLPHI